MNIIYVIDEGPRVYIERINIVGNFRTQDDVIRREFASPKATPSTVCWSRRRARRLRALGFFKTVEVETEPGSAPDRVVIVVKVLEQPTGELSFGAGYSTSEGVIGDISITERNLMGKGQYVRLGFSGSLERAQVDFSFTEPLFPRSQPRRGLRPLPQGGRLDATWPRSASATPAAISAWAFRSPTTPSSGLRYRFEREEIYDVVKQRLAGREGSRRRRSIVSSVGYHGRLRHAQSSASRRPAAFSRPSRRTSPVSAAT